MRNELRTRSRKAGQPPGSLIYSGEHPAVPSQLTLTSYDKDHYQNISNATLEQCLAHKAATGTAWIDVTGLANIESISQLNQHFNIHPLVTEDILNTGQRAKVEEFEQYLFISLKALSWQEASGSFQQEQISLICSEHYLLSFQERPSQLFSKVSERLSYAQGKLRENGVDYLAYALLDIIVDHYFLVLEKFGEIIEQIETEIITRPKPNSARTLYKIKQQMYAFRKAVWPLREVINHLLRVEGKLMSPITAIYLRDVYDHTIQVIETSEAFHDRLDSMLDVHLSTLTNRMNEVMKVLTIIATIFIPLTFIASIYGMNFEYMPELHWRWGYPTTIGLMVVVATIMMSYFKIKKWW